MQAKGQRRASGGRRNASAQNFAVHFFKLLNINNLISGSVARFLFAKVRGNAVGLRSLG
jgi:hypothetical protein